MKASNETWDFVAKSLATMEAQDSLHSKSCRSVLIAAESPLCTPLYAVNEALINALSLLVDDRGEWIEWFVYECKYGKKLMKAGLNNDTRMIDSVEFLRWLVEIKDK